MSLKEYLYKPDYSKCDRKAKNGKPLKEVYHGICKHIKKDNIMYCSRDHKPCPAWKGYKHGMDIK